MQITELAKPFEAYAPRIHAAGCADIRRDMARGYTDRTDQDTDPDEWLEVMFGDIASDKFTPETPQWRKELLDQASEVVIAPCAQKIGFTFPIAAN